MNDANVMKIGMDAMMMTAKLAAPTLLTALLVGVLIGIVQSATQLQEATVSFVPKLLAVGAAVLVQRQLDARPDDRLHAGPVGQRPEPRSLRRLTSTSMSRGSPAGSSEIVVISSASG